MKAVNRIVAMCTALVVAQLMTVSPAHASERDDLILRYRAFIAPAYTPATTRAENGPCTPAGKTPYRFSGDHRTWSATASGARLDMVVYFDWSTKKARVTYKSVGATHRYKKVDGSWVFDAKRQATGEFSAKTVRKDSSGALVDISLKAKNPFCNKLIKPASSHFVIRIEKKRVSIFSGSIRAVPNHDVYVKRFGGSYKSLKRVKSKSLKCLFTVNVCKTVALTTPWVSY